MEDAEQVRHKEECERHGCDEPGSNTLDDPKNLPGPALDPSKWDEVAGRCQTAYPVVNNANKGVWTHAHLDCDINGLAILLESQNRVELFSLMDLSGHEESRKAIRAAEWKAVLIHSGNSCSNGL
jgi:hypothetical protein